jgi:hypothetical protein
MPTRRSTATLLISELDHHDHAFRGVVDRMAAHRTDDLRAPLRRVLQNPVRSLMAVQQRDQFVIPNLRGRHDTPGVKGMSPQLY